MKVLYIAHRINASDGSAVHCRKFVENMNRLGHQIMTYPAMRNGAASKAARRRKKRFMDYVSKVDHKKAIYLANKLTGNKYADLLNYLNGSIDSWIDYVGIAKLLKQFTPDVIIYRHLLFNMAAFRIGKIRKIPVLLECNALKSFEQAIGNARDCSAPVVSKLVFKSEKKAFADADLIFTVSSRSKAQIDQFTGRRNTHVIPNGVDTAMFDPRHYDRDAVKRKLGLEGKTVIGYVGSYQTWHGVDTTIDVMAQLALTSSDYHLLMIGQGARYNAIQQRIRQYRLDRCVTQLGSVPHDSITRYICTFDIALMSYPKITHFHGSPLKMFEYMSMSVPVVATNIGQIGEIITHGRTGILVDDPLPGRFVEAIQKYKDHFGQIGVNARQLMIDQYDWLENAKQVSALCRLIT